MLGRDIGHYRIDQALGEGGMGVVYRARDTRLGRTVAIKVPNAALAARPDRLELFLHEARLLASLDHPHLMAIHEIGEVDGLPFLVMPCAEGPDLRELIRGGPLPVGRALAMAREAAEGLAAAHASGVLHRDVKPANIVLTADGRVRVTDFGLARSLDAGSADNSSAKPASGPAGTIAYLAPELLEGAAPSPASDAWALGVVLYEMLTGRRPFEGDTDAAMTYSILHRDPPRLIAARPDLDSARADLLEPVVRRALDRDPARRYAGLRDMAEDLRKVEAEPMVGLAGRGGRRGRRILLAALALVAAAIVIVVNWPGRPVPAPEPPFLASLQPRRVTSDESRDAAPALSPDGTRIAYASDQDGNFEIYTVETAGGEPVRRTFAAGSDTDPAWFPDNRTLAFVSDRGGEAAVWRLDEDGSVRLLVPGAVDPAVAPEGRRLAFARADQAGNQRIGVAGADGSQARILSAAIEPAWDHKQPAWSPDGERLAFVVHNKGIWSMTAAGEAARRITPDSQIDLEPAWSPDGRSLYCTSFRGNTTALWRLDAAGDAAPLRLTLGTGPESHPSLDRAGRHLAYSTLEDHYRVVLRRRDGITEVALPGAQNDVMPALAPDGSFVVYASNRGGGSYQLWRQDLRDGRPEGAARRLTSHEGTATYPAVSPDGTQIAYYCIEQNQRRLWLVDAGGGQPRQLTGAPDAEDVHPAWSPDGLHLAWASVRDGEYTLMVGEIAEHGGMIGRRRLTEPGLGAYAPVWSPDGDRIAFIGRHLEQDEVWLVDLAAQSPPRQLSSGAAAVRARWDADSCHLLVCGTWGGEEMSLRRLSPDGGDVFPLDPPVSFGAHLRALHFDISHDGRTLVYTRAVRRGNLWVLEAGDRGF